MVLPAFSHKRVPGQLSYKGGMHPQHRHFRDNTSLTTPSLPQHRIGSTPHFLNTVITAKGVNPGRVTVHGGTVSIDGKDLDWFPAFSIMTLLRE